MWRLLREFSLKCHSFFYDVFTRLLYSNKNYNLKLIGTNVVQWLGKSTRELGDPRSNHTAVRKKKRTEKWGKH